MTSPGEARAATPRVARGRAACAVALIGAAALTLSGCAPDYVGASRKARDGAGVVRLLIESGGYTSDRPKSELTLADAVESILRHSGRNGGVYVPPDDAPDKATVYFWVDGNVQSAGGVFDPPDADVRLCVKLEMHDAGRVTLTNARCSGAATPVPPGWRTIGL